MSNFFTPEFNNESAIVPWNASLEPTKAIIPQLDANRVLTGGVGEEVNLPTLTPEAYDNIILPDDLLTRIASAVSTDSNSSLPDSSVDLLTGQAMSGVYGDLSKFVADPDFVAKMNLAFGENWDAAGAKALAEGWFQGDFSDIPPVKVVSSAEIDGANGAFAAATDTIYLSKEFLARNAANPAAVADVLLEEIGHSIDSRFNVTDSPGDEGAIFAAVVQGKELSQGELQALKSEDDRASILLVGEDTTIEMNQQPSALNGTVTRNGQTKQVSLKRVDGDSTDIKNRPTWVVIHGMNNSPQTDSIKELSNAIGDYKKDKNADQVLVLDWSQAAYSDSKLWIPGLGQIPNPYFGASWISTVADWTKKKLVDEWKISPDNINFAGHSLGYYLGWETAKKIGGVNNLIALDPAATTNGGYQEGKVNFSDYSKWAWAFYGSGFGNPDRAYTAEESFKFVFPNGFGGYNPVNAEQEKHGAVVKAFAKMIQKNNAGNPGYISKQLNLNQINQSASKSWSRNNGFEAEINVNNQLLPSLLKHKNGSLAESIYWA
ncbi:MULTISPECIES: hypothetical protein [unclassified Microcoleus]|uniref:hypothetical protein n=1 Tax=unclassified Microcoleus TaxID=2642155 RepID=UPI002FD090D5